MDDELAQRWRDEGWYRDDTLADALRAGAQSHPETRLRFVGQDRLEEASLTEVFSRGSVVAAALQQRGVGTGDVVAIQIPNWVEGAVAYAATMLLGAVVVPIIHIYGVAEVGFILRQSRARVFITPDQWRRVDYTARIPELSQLPDLELVVVVGGSACEGGVAWRDLEVATEPFESPQLHPDDIAFQIYTSGTTSEPKGVRHTHNTLLAEVRSMAAMSDDDTPSTVLGAFPAGHIAGVLSLLRSFVLGTSTVLLDSWDPSLAAQMIERYGASSTAGTPYFVTSLLEAAGRDGRDISSLTRFMVGAANVPRAVVELAEAHGISSYRAYGSTEHPTISSGSPEDPAWARSTTDGRLTPGNEVRIVDDDGNDVPEGEPGEIVSRGPEQFIGYSNPALDADAFLPGRWFRTGDIGVLRDGYLAIVDRKKDIIIRGGENISSKEVEDLLLEHPAVADAAVVAAPDARLGEIVCAFVVVREGAEVDLEEIGEHFRLAGLARQKTPERLELVSELPRGHGGKVQKVDLRRRLATEP